MADDLDQIRDSPEWAATTSDTIRRLLADGPAATVDDPQAITQARTELVRAAKACSPD